MKSATISNGVSNSEKDSLTILLLIKDRPQFTFRWMEYSNSIRFPFKILVADGGKEELVPARLSQVQNYSELNYTYIKYPYDQTRQIFTSKIIDALSRIETPFVSIANDDDFFMVNGLTQAVRFLQKNPEYRTCAGSLVTFSIMPNTNSTYGSDVKFSLVPSHGSLEQDLSMDRVERQFSKYEGTYYDVHRTEDLKRYFERLLELDIKTGILAELVTSFLTVADGKVKREPYLFLLRQSNPLNSQHLKEMKMYGDHFDRMLSEYWSSDFTGFVCAIAEVIVKQDPGLSFEKTKILVRKGYRRFIAPAVIGCLNGEIKSEYTKQKQTSQLGIMQKSIKIYRKYKLSKRNDNNAIERGSHFHKDCEPIRDFLIKKTWKVSPE